LVWLKFTLNIYLEIKKYSNVILWQKDERKTEGNEEESLRQEKREEAIAVRVRILINQR
jgi:hypothetical protein